MNDINNIPPSLEQQVTDARNLAEKVRSIVLKEWFTLNDFVNKSNQGHDQAKAILTHLARFGFIKTVSAEGKYTHKLIFNKTEREEVIQVTIDTIETDIANFHKQIEYLEFLKNTHPSLILKAV